MHTDTEVVSQGAAGWDGQWRRGPRGGRSCAMLGLRIHLTFILRAGKPAEGFKQRDNRINFAYLSHYFIHVTDYLKYFPTKDKPLKEKDHSGMVSGAL